jgi:hypothetical protein
MKKRPEARWRPTNGIAVPEREMAAHKKAYSRG